ncbi:hypothetical protein SUDANB140_03136 [Streptomyces sp. enrichment culture]
MAGIIGHTYALGQLTGGPSTDKSGVVLHAEHPRPNPTRTHPGPQELYALCARSRPSVTRASTASAARSTK